MSADIAGIIRVLNGSCILDEISENDCVYLSGLGRDVLFMEFLGRMGKRAASWLLAGNLGIPRFDPSHDVITLENTAYIQAEMYWFGKTALRLMNVRASHDCNAVAREAISECVRGWITAHTYVRFERQQ